MEKQKLIEDFTHTVEGSTTNHKFFDFKVRSSVFLDSGYKADFYGHDKDSFVYKNRFDDLPRLRNSAEMIAFLKSEEYQLNIKINREKISREIDVLSQTINALSVLLSESCPVSSKEIKEQTLPLLKSLRAARDRQLDRLGAFGHRERGSKAYE